MTSLQIPAALMPKDTAATADTSRLASFGNELGIGISLIIQTVVGLAGAALLIWLYALPAWYAHRRRHPSAGAITVVNLMLGWTLLGWVIALAWANTNPGRAIQGSSAAGFCRACGAIRMPGKFCHGCGASLADS